MSTTPAQTTPPTATASEPPTFVTTSEFEDALTHLVDGDNLALFGGAGTGKSTLIREFRRRIEGERTSLVVAPTGLAALNVGGYTIHRLFSFRPETTLADVESERYSPAKFSAVLAELDVLIIDEVSMVRADMFDMVNTALMKFGPEPGKPFGGVQIVLVGDLYQLAPIVSRSDRKSFEASYDAPYFFASKAYDPDDFAVVELTRVFRQEGDTRFIDILNGVRVGEMSSQDREDLNARVDRDFMAPVGEKWLTLTTTRKVADEHNGRNLAALPGWATQLHSSQSGDLEGFEIPVPRQIDVKAGAQVMMATNDTEGRWVNGSIGTVLEVGSSSWGSRPAYVKVEIDGKPPVFVTAYEWPVTKPVMGPGHSIEHQEVGSYVQFPFKLAWAVTIHKSQGQTLDKVIVDLTGGTFAAGQLYVALSRCTSLAGMVLKRAVRPSDLKVDKKVTRYLAENTVMEQAEALVRLHALTAGGRILELTATGADGESVSTLVNPGNDYVLEALEAGIDPTLVPLAPSIEQAWEAISGFCQDAAPAGVGIDGTLALLRQDLARVGSTARVPRSGVELAPEEPLAQSVPARARPIHATDALGYRLTRGTWPECLAGDDPDVALDHLREIARAYEGNAYLAQRLAEAEARLGALA